MFLSSSSRMRTVLKFLTCNIRDKQTYACGTFGPGPHTSPWQPQTPFQTVSLRPPRVPLHTTYTFYLYASLSWTRFGPIVWEQHQKRKTKPIHWEKMDIVGAQKNLHTLLIPFSGDVRAKEYAFLKKSHTCIKKCRGLPALSFKRTFTKRRNVNDSLTVCPSSPLSFPSSAP